MSEAISVLPFPGSRLAQLEGRFSGALLLVGEPGVGKTSYCIQFARDGLVNGQAVLYICTDHPPDQIRQLLRRIGPMPIPEASMKNLRIIDHYSWRTGILEETYSTTNPNLSELALVLSKAREGISNFRMVVDSISGLSLGTSIEALVKFLQVTFGRVKVAGSVGLFVAEEGAHEKQLGTYLRFISDGVLEMSLIETERGEITRKFRIFCLRQLKHSTSWVPFSISGEGIRFEF